MEAFGEEAFEEHKKEIGDVFDRVLKEEVRKMITEQGIRPDGRRHDEIRPIWCEVGFLPRVHGSGLFTAGSDPGGSPPALWGSSRTSRSSTTSATRIASATFTTTTFPAFRWVRPGRCGSPGRREIGHGALAERALLPVIPSEEEFPYTLRLVSEVLSSNGSTSQASVCGSTLALMDAGVPIKRPVAGIAMGLVKHGDQFAILTDIQGIEDAWGTWTSRWPAPRGASPRCRWTSRSAGVYREILAKALEQAREGRMYILEQMLEVDRQAPARPLAVGAAHHHASRIPVDKIRDVIGPGGKMIRKIIDETGVQIDVEDDGRIFIASTAEEGAQKAVAMIEALTRDVEVGAVYTGKVKRIMNFGAFVEILPGKEGLVHISKLSHERVGRVEDVVNIGDEITVMVTDIDAFGRINLTRKDLLPPPEPSEKRAGERNGSRSQGGPRGDRRRGFGRGDRGR